MLGDADLVQAVLADYRTAPITEAERALFAFVEKVNRNSVAILPEDLTAARTAGWSEEALYDAITVCALFNFYNLWIDATGVQDMPASAYALTGQRLAEHGYVTVADGPISEATTTER